MRAHVSLGILLSLGACTPTSISKPPGGGPGSDTPDDTAGTDDTDTPDDTAATDDTGEPVVGCTLRATGTLHVEEGTAVSLSVACADGSLPEEALEIAGLPAGALQEGAQVTWTPGLADGGRYDLVFSTAGGDAGTATLWVSDAFDSPGNVPVDPTLYMAEDGLPVLFLYPAPDLNNSNDTPAELIFNGRTYGVEMQTRGASSLYYPQQSYTVKFDKDDRIDAAALGLAKFDDLILQTTFDDVVGVRNALCHRLWASLDEARMAPQTFMVVVYMNGAFHGLYQGIERIDDDFYDVRGLSEDGDLYKSTSHDANFYTTNASGAGKWTLHDGYEKSSGTPEEGEAGAFDTLDALVSFAALSDSTTFHADLDQWVEPEEIMDWFAFVTFGMVTDSAGKNVLLYNDPTEDTRFRVTPWDFNASFGQQWETSKIAVEYNSTFTWTNNLFNRFLASSTLSDAMWSRYRTQLDSGPLQRTEVRALADTLLEETAWARPRSWRRWGSQYRGYFGHGANPADEATYLQDWIDARWSVISDWVDARGL